MVPLLQMNTADRAYMRIFTSVTRPFSRFLGGAWGRSWEGEGGGGGGWVEYIFSVSFVLGLW